MPLRRSQTPSWKLIDHWKKDKQDVAHRLLEEIPLQSEAVTKAAELNSSRDKRGYTEVYESETDANIISGKWVLKRHKARYVLRGFEEDVKDEDDFANISEDATFSQATDIRTEGYTVFRRENRLPQRTYEGR